MAFGGVGFFVFASVFVFCFCLGLPSFNADGITDHDSDKVNSKRATTAFFDDFSSGHIDGSKWKHEVIANGGGNNEFEMYTPLPENSYVKNGNLYICPTLTSDHFGANIIHGSIDLTAQFGHCDSNCHQSGYGNVPVIMSGKLTSKGSIRYGRVEVVAQLPKGDWLWPAIWMKPTESHYGGWPKSGEIDIMEAKCNTNYFYSNGKPAGVNKEAATIHYGLDKHNKTQHSGAFTLTGATLGDGFHTYWMNWTASHIIIGMDSHTLLQQNTPANGYWSDTHLPGTNIWSSGGRDAPFDRPFYLILNVAVGGNYFNHGSVNHPYVQPWHDGVAHDQMMREFWEARHLWQPTWHGDQACMKVKSVNLQQA